MLPHRLAVLALLAACSACSFVGIRGPLHHVTNPRAPIRCTPSPEPASADALFALGAGVGALGLLVSDSLDYRCAASPAGCPLKHATASAALATAGVAFLFSSVHGFRTAARCRDALDLQTRCQRGNAEACLALTGGAGIALPDPEARPTGTQTAP